MNSEPSPSPVVPHQPPVKGGTLRNLQLVLIVAVVVATLFTAWTEPGLLPGSLSEKFTNAIQSFSTTPQANWPTATPRPVAHIGIVAGHSGYDIGAVCPEELGSTREVDINLDVANQVRESLVKAGYEVDLLSEFDNRLTGYRALALVSIHADSCQYINDQATGFKVAAAMSTSYPERAQRLTNCLRTRYADATGMPFHSGSVTRDMTSYHAFEEVDKETPAAIIEVGFMNLDHDMLTKHRDLIAKGITDGVLCFVRNESILPTPSTAP